MIKRGLREVRSLRADKMTGCIAQRNIFGEVESLPPIDDLAVSVVRIFGTERRPADQTFKHDGSNGPPVTAECVAFASKNLGCNIIRGSDCGVGHLAARFSPRVDLASIAYSEVDLIETDRMPIIFWLRRRTFEKLLVVRILVLYLEACGQSKVGKLDMPTCVEKDVVWFDVPFSTVSSVYHMHYCQTTASPGLGAAGVCRG